MLMAIIIGVERERKTNFFMETQDIEVNSIEEEQELFPEVRNKHYDGRIKDAERMRRFLETSDDFAKIKMYQYVLKKARYLDKLGTEEAREMIPFCWLSSMELENTEALKKYFNGEITQEMIDQHDKEEAEKIVQEMQARRKERNSIGYKTRKFLGLKPKQNGRKR